MNFVSRVNKLSREVPGGEVFHDLGISRDDAGRHCPMCRYKGHCLGPNCLGYSGMRLSSCGQKFSVFRPGFRSFLQSRHAF